ncbi:uridine kinase [Virgibacillus phasianinus]|uniref:Uridine kinase n=1 Tax=Virgibacillus phasianinus TaxID=2017483 RepID=A0A220U612_9BACI|nr:kinase [Virgibacillus phasianinus]ASK63744.1 uridine kinase [Virgibacillus phasianinus]
MEEQIIEIISKNLLKERFILGIDVLSRSGKTTLVAKVSSILKSENIPFRIIHIDDQIVERKKRYNTGHKEWVEYYQLQWDVIWLQDHLFKKIKKSNEITLPFYKDKTDSHVCRQLDVPRNCIILIEGVFLQRKEWRGYFDYVVFLDCPRNKRFIRESELAQKEMEKFQNRYWKAENYYMETVDPVGQANLVISS